MALFTLGQVVATPGALSALAVASVEPLELLRRHVTGDWGVLSPGDARENARSVKHGWRILSSYPLGENGEKVWILTEADRSATTLLRPEEY